MKVADGIYLAASGASGISLTHATDCNAYAIDCGGTFVLIDCGTGIAPSLLLEQLAADGISANALKHLLLTHYHLDHCGGARWLRDEIEIEVAGSALTAAAVSSADAETISLNAAKRAGAYPADVRLTPCPVDRVVANGEVLAIGTVEIEALATPGHSRDMLSYFVRRNGRTHLFSGDTLFYGGKVLLSNTHDCDAPALCRSLTALAASQFEGLFPGHQLWSLRDGHRHALAAMDYVNRLLLPPSL